MRFLQRIQNVLTLTKEASIRPSAKTFDQIYCSIQTRTIWFDNVRDRQVLMTVTSEAPKDIRRKTQAPDRCEKAFALKELHLPLIWSVRTKIKVNRIIAKIFEVDISLSKFVFCSNRAHGCPSSEFLGPKAA